MLDNTWKHFRIAADAHMSKESLGAICKTAANAFEAKATGTRELISIRNPMNVTKWYIFRCFRHS